jgi:hypothetical protein
VISDPNLSFVYETGDPFARAGTNLATGAQGVCTVLSLEYDCEITVTGEWSPVPDQFDPTHIIGATLSNSALVIRTI